MKILAFIIFQLLATLSYSQADWFPTGARWTFEWGAFGGWGYVTIDVLPGDTMLLGKAYKKVLISNYLMGDDSSIDSVITELTFFYEEDGRVYQGAQLLYDFTAEVGDTLHSMYAPGLSKGDFVVDSIGTMEINGVTLRFQDIVFPKLFQPTEYLTMRVLEKVGSLNTHFLYYLSVVQPVDAAFYHLRCYRDEEVGYYIPDLSPPAICDEITGESHIEKSIAHVSIYPNPFQDFIRIHSSENEFDHVVIFDMLGRIQRMNAQAIDAYMELDLRELNSGIYFVCLVNKDGQIMVLEKMIKQF